MYINTTASAPPIHPFLLTIFVLSRKFCFLCHLNLHPSHEEIMPRRSSGRSGGPAWSAPHPAATNPRPAPVQAPAPPAAPLKSTTVGGGLGSVVAEGMAFGGGSAIAHRAVDSMLGPRTIRHESAASSAPAAAAEATTMNTAGGSDACGVQSKAFQDCLNYQATISASANSIWICSLNAAKALMLA
ncbi:Hypothetical predicted protein [Olea europaea subsp. europaea]|uniref:Uncharacterized protein n=1 Tax=Olea europaea subsp. europaea TaxID=158383 RepID=A0A8S0UKA0_OLEEU|nr:Hypothetical predicted protein [Olea europaea subsp. europaea]